MITTVFQMSSSSKLTKKVNASSGYCHLAKTLVYLLLYVGQNNIMKKLLLTISFGFLTVGLFAQIISVSGDTIFANGLATDFELVGNADIRNTSTTSANFRWVRITNNLTTNWKTAICDVVTCYSDNTDSSDFSLSANAVGNMDAHFYPYSTNGSGITRVRVFEIANPSNQTIITFIGATNPTSVADLKKPEFKLYPVPATDVLYLMGTKNLSQGKLEIYNAIGKKIQELNFSNAQLQAIEVPIQTLPKGNYILRVFNGKQVVSKTFIKN
jgi:hypothetical protein